MNLNIDLLNKKYPNDVKALDNLSLDIGKGMFGLLGPNGAGKSSLMRTIATLQQADSGSIQYGDIDVFNQPQELRKALGYLPQNFGVYKKVSAEKLLNYLALLKGISSKKDRNIITDKVLELTNLYDVKKKNVSDYSGGMRQRFGIAQLLLNQPSLIIVDEPTAGLDPAERKRFLNVLRDVGTENTVIFSTHIVEDVKELCTDMAIMNKGKIFLHEKPSIATKNVEGKIWTTIIDKNELKDYKNKYPLLAYNYNEDHKLVIRIFSEEKPTENFNSINPNLEDIYFLTLGETLV